MIVLMGLKSSKNNFQFYLRALLIRLDSLIKEYNTDVIIAVGEEGGRAAISIERVAINVDG